MGNDSSGLERSCYIISPASLVWMTVACHARSPSHSSLLSNRLLSNHGLCSACVVSLLPGSSSPSSLPLCRVRPHDIPIALEQAPPSCSPCLQNLVPSPHPPPCDWSDLSSMKVTLLNPSVVFHGRQETSWVGRGTPSSPPDTPYVYFLNMACSLMWLYTLLPLSRPFCFLLGFLYGNSYVFFRTQTAVVSKESTLTFPSSSYWAMPGFLPMQLIRQDFHHLFS